MRLRLLSDRRGATAIEFALAAPVMIAMVIGVFQLGQLFFANAGLHHTVEQAARFAAVYPAPTTDEITAKIHEGQVGLRGTLSPTLAVTTVANGPDLLDITLNYRVPLDFIFFQTPPVTLTHTRRVFLLEDKSVSPSSSSSSSASSSTSTSTSAGGTSAGGTTTGGTDGGTSSTTSSTTTSTGGGTSNGNSNGGGNGNNGNSNGNSNGGG